MRQKLPGPIFNANAQVCFTSTGHSIEHINLLREIRYSSLNLILNGLAYLYFFILENVGNDISYRILSEKSLRTDVIHAQYQQITHRQTNAFFIFKYHINVTGVRTENVLMPKYSSVPYLFF